MKQVKATSKDFEKKVTEMLKDYYETVDEKTTDLISEVASETANELLNTSPKDNGQYAKSWYVKNISKSPYKIEVLIANKLYQLTHLLEYGHQGFAHGKWIGFIKPKPHIRNAEQKAIRKILERLKGVAK